MKLRLTSAILGLSLFLLMPALARADALYTYNQSFSSAPDGPSTFGWSFDESSLLTSTATITTFLSASVTGALSSCTITSAVIANPATTFDVTTNFTGSGCPIESFEIGPGTPGITSLGTYGPFTGTTPPFTLVLTVTSTAATPESSSLVLFGLGLAGVGLLMRKRLAQQLRLNGGTPRTL
jgi:hypothetical protein